MEDIKKLYALYWLKDIYRVSPVGNRKESVAEHCWSSLLLADYFLEKIEDVSFRREKVYDLLIYHDLIELETWDIPIHDSKHGKYKKENEMIALPDLIKKIPRKIKNKFEKLHYEFEENSTLEAKFANAVDKLDAMIQCLYDKELFVENNYTEGTLRKKKQKYMEVFPEIEEMYETLIDYYSVNWYLEEGN